MPAAAGQPPPKGDLHAPCPGGAAGVAANVDRRLDGAATAAGRGAARGLALPLLLQHSQPGCPLLCLQRLSRCLLLLCTPPGLKGSCHVAALLLGRCNAAGWCRGPTGRCRAQATSCCSAEHAKCWLHSGEQPLCSMKTAMQPLGWCARHVPLPPAEVQRGPAARNTCAQALVR